MLTLEQVREVYYFVASKYVRYYDLQMELVHQLINRVEDQLELDPGQTFENAMESVCNKLDKNEFGRILKRKEEAMEKRNTRLWKQEFFHWFTLPKAIGVLLAFFLLWVICKNISVSYVVLAFISFCIIEGLLLHLQGRVSILHNKAPLLMLVPFRLSFFQLGFSIAFIPFYIYVVFRGFRLLSVDSFWLENHAWIVALWIVVSLLLMAGHLAVYQRVLITAKIKYPGFFKED